jgi:hypothetical protein
MQACTHGRAKEIIMAHGRFMPPIIISISAINVQTQVQQNKIKRALLLKTGHGEIYTKTPWTCQRTQIKSTNNWQSSFTYQVVKSESPHHPGLILLLESSFINQRVCML